MVAIMEKLHGNRIGKFTISHSGIIRSFSWKIVALKVPIKVSVRQVSGRSQAFLKN